MRFFLVSLCVLLIGASGQAVAKSPKCLPDGRPLTYDRMGMLPITADGSFDEEQTRILSLFGQAELGEAFRRSRARLIDKPNDYQTAWLLVQSVRLRNTFETAIPDLEAILVKNPKHHAVHFALVRLHDSVRMDALFYRTGNRSMETTTKSYHRYSALISKWMTGQTSQESDHPLSLALLSVIADDPEFPHARAKTLIESYVADHGKNDHLALYAILRVMSGRAPTKGEKVPGVTYADDALAESLLKDLRKRKPGLTEALYFLGDLRVRQKRPKEAAAFFQAYLESEPKSSVMARIAAEYVKSPNFMVVRQKLPV